MRVFPGASCPVFRALIDEVEHQKPPAGERAGCEGAKLTQLSCTFALSFAPLWFPCFSDYASPTLSCWTRATIRACRPQRRRPAWWSMSSMVSSVRDLTSPVVVILISIFIFVSISLCRREPRGDAEERSQWLLHMEQQSPGPAPAPGHGCQLRGAMAYWWQSEPEQQQQRQQLLEFIHSAYQLLPPA